MDNELVVTKYEQNQRLDKFLLKYFNKAPKSFVYKMLRKKRIKLNDKKAEGSEILKIDDTLKFYIAKETMESFMEEKVLNATKITFGVLYEDENVLLASKPVGMLCHPESDTSKDTLVDQVLFYLLKKGEYSPSKFNSFTPALCNRLDRNTSGIVLVGKNLMAVQNLNKAIATFNVDKFYLTIVKGKTEREGEIVGFHSKDGFNNEVSISSKQSASDKKVVTKFVTLKFNGEYSLLEIHLITGKSHQIRAHLKSVHTPLIGDRKYGDDAVNKKFLKLGLKNQFLHCHKVVFKDCFELSYLNGKEFCCPLPSTFLNIKEDLFS